MATYGKENYFNANSGNKHLNASGFMGTGISTLKVIWWGIGSLVVLAVVAKGLKVYRSAKYY